MTDTITFGLPDAARSLGVPIRVLRRAIRAGRIPAPAHLTATVSLSPEWLTSARAAAAASPNTLSRNPGQKTPAFARYKGTSAWHKYRVRVRGYANFKATQAQASA
jgi:transcription elongation factor